MADIKDVVATNATVDIKHPATGELIGLRLHLLHDDEPPLRDLQRKWQNEALHRQQRGRGLNADKIEARTLDRLVAATAAWEWGVDANGEKCTFDGEQPEFTPDNVRKLYKAKSFIRNQVGDVMTDESEFFRGRD